MCNIHLMYSVRSQCVCDAFNWNWNVVLFIYLLVFHCRKYKRFQLHLYHHEAHLHTHTLTVWHWLSFKLNYLNFRMNCSVCTRVGRGVFVSYSMWMIFPHSLLVLLSYFPLSSFERTLFFIFSSFNYNISE